MGGNWGAISGFPGGHDEADDEVRLSKRRTRWLRIRFGAATVPVVGLVVAVLALGTSVWSVHTAKRNLTVSVLLSMEREFNSARMLKSRRLAAEGLLQHREVDELDDVLDSFDSVGLLVRRGVLDREMVWATLYDPAAHYYVASRKVVLKAQRDEPDVFLYRTGWRGCSCY